MKKQNAIKECLNELRTIVRNSQELTEYEFGIKYYKKPAKIIMVSPYIYNELMVLFRSRRNDFKLDEDLSSQSSFSYIPPKKCTAAFPAIERANYAGQSMFYGSVDPETNIKEVLSKCKDGEIYNMGIWKIRKNSQIHLYPALPPKDVRPFIQHTIIPELLPYDIEELIGYLEELSFVLTSTEKGCYLASSYIYNSILKVNLNLKRADGDSINVKYDGILYPSARGVENEWNFALPPHIVDNCMELVAVMRVVKDSSRKDQYSFKEIGFCNNQTITWYNMHFDEDCINSFELGLIDDNNNLIDISKGTVFDENSNVVPLVRDRHYTQEYILNDFYEELANEANKDICTAKEFVTKELLEGLRIREFIHSKQNWRYVENGNVTIIDKLYCKFKYKIELVETDWHNFISNEQIVNKDINKRSNGD